MNIVGNIYNHHQTLQELIKKIEGTLIHVQEKRVQLARLGNNFIAHNKALEQVFYPLLLKDKALYLQVLICFEEHNLLEHLINQLEGLFLSEEEWEAKFDLFKRLVLMHIDRLESVILNSPSFLHKLDKLEQLEKEYKVAKASYLSNPRKMMEINKI